MCTGPGLAWHGMACNKSTEILVLKLKKNSTSMLMIVELSWTHPSGVLDSGTQKCFICVIIYIKIRLFFTPISYTYYSNTHCFDVMRLLCATLLNINGRRGAELWDTQHCNENEYCWTKQISGNLTRILWRRLSIVFFYMKAIQTYITCSCRKRIFIFIRFYKYM